MQARSAVAYAGPARPFVRAWKEGGLRHLAPTAAALIADLIEPSRADAVTPIPPDPVRQLGRSRHPAEGLARSLARTWGLNEQRLLLRAAAGVPARQASLPYAGRRANVRGAFEAAGEVPRCVLLVDDVYTTGATASAAATALCRAGAQRVEVVTFARAVRYP